MPYKIEHEWDHEEEMHRLKVVEYNPKVFIFGGWCSYKVPATVSYNNRTFVWFSQYWLGHFPLEVIMELKELANNG